MGRERNENLTESEEKIMELIVQGFSDVEITDKLSITISTLKTKLCNITTKFIYLIPDYYTKKRISRKYLTKIYLKQKKIEIV